MFYKKYEKNLETARTWGVSDESRVYADYREMAERESSLEDGIDFVSITTPNDTHYEIAKCFMEHGIHIMCDKPLALTAAEGEELAALAEKKRIAVRCDLYIYRLCDGPAGQRSD